MDDESFSYLKNLKLNSVYVISYLDLEESIPELKNAKLNRSLIEYFYTCSPAICYYALMNFIEIDLITYLDSDLYFFSSPEPLFTELENKSIGIIAHRFNWLTKHNLKYGIFNVGWVSFRKDDIGLNCLTDWMFDCINWCYQKLENGKYADQKYLDIWPEKYSKLCIIKNICANVAIWNIGNYKLSNVGNDIFVNGEKLIFYHFASFKQVSEFEFTSDLSRVLVRTTNLIRDLIYIPYAKSILKFQIHPIKTKQDIKDTFLLHNIKNISRYIRQYIFPDKIIIN
ncbi:MAG: hypothetical protein WCG95_02985 [bacterium]